MDKPTFSVDQIIKSSDLVRDFSKIRKKSKDNPYFITDNGNIEAVLVGYDKYEELYQTFLMYNDMEKRLEELEQQIADYRMDKSEKDPDSLVDWRSVRRTSSEE